MSLTINYPVTRVISLCLYFLLFLVWNKVAVAVKHGIVRVLKDSTASGGKNNLWYCLPLCGHASNIIYSACFAASFSDFK